MAAGFREHRTLTTPAPPSDTPKLTLTLPARAHSSAEQPRTRSVVRSLSLQPNQGDQARTLSRMPSLSLSLFAIVQDLISALLHAAGVLAVTAKLYETHGQELPHRAWLRPPGLSHLGKGLTLAKPDGTNEGSAYRNSYLSHDWLLLRTARTARTE